jgi:hypothetical protein
VRTSRVRARSGCSLVCSRMLTLRFLVLSDHSLERYSSMPEDLSNCATPDAFRDGLAEVVAAAATARSCAPAAGADRPCALH